MKIKLYTYNTPKGRYQIKDSGRKLTITYPIDNTSKHYDGGAWIMHETEDGYHKDEFCDLVERCNDFEDAYRVLSDILHLTRCTTAELSTMLESESIKSIEYTFDEAIRYIESRLAAVFPGMKTQVRQYTYDEDPNAYFVEVFNVEPEKLVEFENKVQNIIDEVGDLKEGSYFIPSIFSIKQTKLLDQ